MAPAVALSPLGGKRIPFCFPWSSMFKSRLLILVFIVLVVLRIVLLCYSSIVAMQWSVMAIYAFGYEQAEEPLLDSGCLS